MRVAPVGLYFHNDHDIVNATIGAVIVLVILSPRSAVAARRAPECQLAF